MGVPYSQGAESGRPVIDVSSCNACGDCSFVCPVGVLASADDHIAIQPDLAFGCIACGHCIMVCPTGAIRVSGRGLEERQLVGLPTRSARADADALRALMLGRRSIRRFTRDEVPRALLERVVADAATAPMGIPPWDVGVVVLRGRQQVHELAGDVAGLYRGLLRVVDNPVGRGLLRLFMSRQAYRQMAGFILPLGREIVEQWNAGRDVVLHDAPAAMLFHASSYADPADAMIACSYAMLSAEANGLGTTMIGCVSPPLARRRPLLLKHGVPAGNVPKMVLILGYPAIAFQRAVERPLASVTYH